MRRILVLVLVGLMGVLLVSPGALAAKDSYTRGDAQYSLMMGPWGYFDAYWDCYSWTSDQDVVADGDCSQLEEAFERFYGPRLWFGAGSPYCSSDWLVHSVYMVIGVEQLNDYPWPMEFSLFLDGEPIQVQPVRPRRHTHWEFNPLMDPAPRYAVTAGAGALVPAGTLEPGTHTAGFLSGGGVVEWFFEVGDC